MKTKFDKLGKELNKTFDLLHDQLKKSNGNGPIPDHLRYKGIKYDPEEEICTVPDIPIVVED